MNIDLHNHVVPPTIVEALTRDPKRYGTWIEMKDGKRYFSVHGPIAELKPTFFDVGAKVEWMDQVGLDVAVISVGPPIYFCWLSPDVGLEAARLANDGISAMVAARPERLRGMAHLPMQDPDAAIVELERVVKEHTQTSPRDLLKRFYFDALTHDPRAARHLINVAGADRVVIGADHLFDMGPDDPVGSIDAIPGLTATEREYVCERTAKALLGEA